MMRLQGQAKFHAYSTTQWIDDQDLSCKHGHKTGSKTETKSDNYNNETFSTIAN